jgi:hypothetical protein
MNPDPAARLELMKSLGDVVRPAIHSETVSIVEAVFCLSDLFPELCLSSFAVGNLQAAYDSAIRRNIRPCLDERLMWQYFADCEREHPGLLRDNLAAYRKRMGQ